MALDGDYGIAEADQCIYNLTVDGAHTFFIGAGAWRVHNDEIIALIQTGDGENMATILLDTYGYLVKFDVLNATYDEISNIKVFDITLTMITKTKKHVHVFETMQYTLFDKDIMRLKDYFDKHLFELQRNNFYNSDIFTTYDLFFQIRALSGEIWRDEGNNLDGEVSILVLLNISPYGKKRIYLGSESTIIIGNIMKFQRELMQILNIS